MIFITGDPFQLPWMKSSRKVQVLIRMCIKTNKILFGCSFAMMSYIYLCATNFEHDISVVNGKQKGGMIGDLRSMDKDMYELLNKDYFLDNASGDLYQYSQPTDEWVAQANIGLHYHKAASKFMSLGKFNIQTPIFKGISKPLSEKNFISRINEDIAYIKKVYIKHWLVNGLDMSFIIPQRSTWFQHNVQFVNSNKSYTIIADNNKGGVIFESKNSVLIQFEILSKYSQTLVPLQNFIQNKLKQIKSTNKNCDSSIIDYYQNLKNVQMSNLTKNIKKAKQRHMDFKLFNSISQKNPANEDIHQNNVFHQKFKIHKKEKTVDSDNNLEDLNLRLGNRKGCKLIQIEKQYPVMDKREVVEQLHPNIFKQKQNYQMNEKLNTQQNENANLEKMIPSQNDYNQNLAQYTKKIFVPGNLSDNVRKRNVQSQGSIIRIRDLKSQSTNGVKKSYQEFTKQRIKKFNQIAKVVQLEQEEYGVGVYMSQEEILEKIQRNYDKKCYQINQMNVFQKTGSQFTFKE